LIESGKQGCAWDWFDAKDFEANRVSFLIKVLAFNLLRAFQRQALRETCARWEIRTVIRRIIRIPARLIRRGKGWVMRAVRNHPMARVLEEAQTRILALAVAASG